ncbi:MAG TPA: FIST N-terminal domain-containing protein [Polyangia bacterium]|nr:FIST N-terminal domain-containing protein [Polyangia bacterium]
MASIQLKSARSEAQDPTQIADELMTQLGGFTPKLVTLFASRDRDQRALNRALRDRLPKGTRLIGSTTAGEIDRDGLHMGSVVLGALGGDFDVGLGLGGGLSRDAVAAGTQAINRACEELGTRSSDLNARKHVGVVIDDGFQSKKEELLLGILDRNQGLVLVGGGASDGERDPSKASAEIHVDGEVVSDAALVALFHTDAPWAALRSHWYEPTGQMLTITKVDDSHRRALEIDGQPAALRYAELIGVKPEELPFGMPNGISARPTALKVGREYFMRAGGWPLPDGSIVFANLLEENSEYELMRALDPVESTRKFLTEEIGRRVHDPTAALMFHCGGRMWAASAGGFIPQLSDAFKQAPPSVGFNVQFEIYCGFHINTTLTSLVFGTSQS